MYPIFLKKKFFMVYEELKKRNLIKNEKEFQELIWLKQIKINDKILHRDKKKKRNIKTIKIGIKEIEI